MSRLLVAAVALCVVAAGCGGVENEPNLAKAAERTQASGSSRIEVRSLLKDTGREVAVTCSGSADYARKRMQLVCNPELGEWIVVGNTMYFKGEGLFGTGVGKGWLKVPLDADAIHDLSPDKLLALLRNGSRDTKRIGPVEVRGESTVRYELTVNCEEADLACPGPTAPVEVWIDHAGLVRRIEIEDGGTPVTIEFFDFGLEIDIEPPPADQVDETVEGWTGYAPTQDGNVAPCSEGEGTPITEQRAFDVLRRHGFSMSIEQCVGGPGVVAGITNHEGADAVLAREGLVFCHVHETPPEGASSAVLRRGADGADAELVLANLTCTILADSPRGEEKIDKLEAAFEELERAIQP